MKKNILVIILVCLWGYVQAQSEGSISLLKKKEGSNYFINQSGKAVLLVGSHTWENFQEVTKKGELPFDWPAYLKMMKENKHNFIRLWIWEQCWGAAWTDEEVFVDPLPYQRLGSGLAKDGKPKFDLTKWNQDYFDRLLKRVKEAGEQGIYVSVMMFQGWSLNKSDSEKSDPYLGHPFNMANNVNGINFENSNKDDDEKATLHSMKLPEILELQEAYVKKVIETVNDLDNVLYEIINEGGALDWQEHMVDFIRKQESSMPKQHPVGITARVSPLLLNDDLFASNADWVSPDNEPVSWMFPGTQRLSDYEENPPANDGRKVVILDTDHLWGHGGNYSWAWKSFCRGHNPIFMDPWESLPGSLNREKVPWMFVDGGISKDSRDYPDWELLRYNMGIIKELSGRLELTNMKPYDLFSSTGYCLAEPGKTYVIYYPEPGKATINLTAKEVNYHVKWYIPVLNRWVDGTEPVKGGGYVSLEGPFTGDVVLILEVVK